MNVLGDRDLARGYLAAMIDGEGSVGNSLRRYSKGYYRGVKIVNTDSNLIAATAKACDTLGITYTIRIVEESRKAHWKPCHYLSIYGKANLERLLEEVPIQSKTKYDNLKRSIESYRYEQVDDTKIKSLYESGLSSNKIAIQTGHSKSTILRSLHRNHVVIR